MADQITRFRMLVACPSDLEEEVDHIINVVSQLNIQWALEYKIYVEVVNWKTHTHPSIGQDPQSIINEQIADNYDIYFGMLWHRSGTETPRDSSGTIEEYHRAYKRWILDNDSINIMFYFKTADPPMSAIDPVQLGIVKDFRKEISEHSLYGSFGTKSELENAIRVDLLRCIKERMALVSQKDVNSDQQLRVVETFEIQVDEDGLQGNDNEEIEAGLIDLQDDVEAAFSELERIANRIVEQTEKIGVRFNERTAEINKGNSQHNVDASSIRKMVKRNCRILASDLSKYADALNSLLPQFEANLNEGISSFARTIPILQRFNDDFEVQRTQKEEIRGLTDALNSASDGIESFKEVLEKFPSMTTVLNRARRETVKALKYAIHVLRDSEIQLNDVLNLIE